MEIQKIYHEDLKIAQALIKRDNTVTRKYFYQQCYPLFKSVYDNYYTDCQDCKEFIDEIYIVVLAPSKVTGKCQMENFRGESTLTSWIKTACLFYCYNKFDKRKDSEKKSLDGDRKLEKYGSIEIELDSMNRMDIETLIGMMRNERYRKIIQLRYLEHLSNEETAEALGMTMANFYNKHKLAKEQFLSVSREEVKHG